MLSDSVRTDMRTSPRAFLTLVAHVAEPVAAPSSFLQTFLVESIFKIDPPTEVTAA